MSSVVALQGHAFHSRRRKALAYVALVACSWAASCNAPNAEEEYSVGKDTIIDFHNGRFQLIDHNDSNAFWDNKRDRIAPVFRDVVGWNEIENFFYMKTSKPEFGLLSIKDSTFVKYKDLKEIPDVHRNRFVELKTQPRQ